MAPMIAVPFVTLLLVATAAAPASITWDEALTRASLPPAARAAADAARDQRELGESISGLPNPEIAILPGVRYLPEGSVFTGEASVSQGIPLASTGATRREANRSEAAALDGQARLLSLAARSDAAEAFCNLRGLEDSIEFARGEEKMAEDFLERVRLGARSGIFTATELADAEAFAAEASLHRITLEGRSFSLGTDLARLVGYEAPTPLVTSGPLPAFSTPDEDQKRMLLASADKLPSVVVEDLQVRALRAREEEARVDAIPSLSVGAAAIRDNPDDKAWFATFSMDLPLFDRGQRQRAALRGEARAREGEKAQALLNARRLVADALFELEQTGRILEVLDGRLLPSAREVAKLVEFSHRSGETTVIEVLRARRALLQVEARQRQAAADHVLAQARVHLLLDALAPGERP